MKFLARWHTTSFSPPHLVIHVMCPRDASHKCVQLGNNASHRIPASKLLPFGKTACQVRHPWGTKGVDGTRDFGWSGGDRSPMQFSFGEKTSRPTRRAARQMGTRKTSHVSKGGASGLLTAAPGPGRTRSMSSTAVIATDLLRRPQNR